MDMTPKRATAPHPVPAAGGSATIERTSIVAYALMRELQAALDDGREGEGDDVTLGIVMGLAMFLDDRVGPFRADRLMRRAPGIVLETDAHVTDRQVERFASVLSAFGEHLVRVADA
jgi:hypothetical protein